MHIGIAVSALLNLKLFVILKTRETNLYGHLLPTVKFDKSSNSSLFRSLEKKNGDALSSPLRVTVFLLNKACSPSDKL